MEAQTVEPTFNRIIKDFQHFLNIREDNHKYIDHLFMERLKFEAELIERLENQIDQLKSMTLKQCPNCGIKRPKRYHRSTQTPPYPFVIIKNTNETVPDAAINSRFPTSP